ncbi:hypothetical protein [Caballeronia insecticola]|uniref:hypothetical protein n=1 Tax=Caballeronia insecticola TaxID=758793 RepID=UPI0005C62759|nr:hypothetical protein [Caballeronia insecticola]
MRSFSDNQKIMRTRKALLIPVALGLLSSGAPAWAKYTEQWISTSDLAHVRPAARVEHVERADRVERVKHVERAQHTQAVVATHKKQADAHASLKSHHAALQAKSAAGQDDPIAAFAHEPRPSSRAKTARR